MPVCQCTRASAGRTQTRLAGVQGKGCLGLYGARLVPLASSWCSAAWLHRPLPVWPCSGHPALAPTSASPSASTGLVLLPSCCCTSCAHSLSLPSLAAAISPFLPCWLAIQASVPGTAGTDGSCCLSSEWQGKWGRGSGRRAAVVDGAKWQKKHGAVPVT